MSTVPGQRSGDAADDATLFAIHRADLPTYLSFAEQRPRVYYSAGLRSWVSLDPHKSLAFLRDRRLAGANAEAPLRSLEAHIQAPLPALIFAAGHIPTMLEGDDHAKARRSVALVLAKKRDALAEAMPGLVETHLRPLREQDAVELIAEVLAPLIASVFGAVMGIGTAKADRRFEGGRIFDRFIGSGALQTAESEMAGTLTEIRRRVGAACPDSVVGAMLALNVLGRDTLVGSLAGGLIRLIPSSEGVRLDRIVFPDTPPDTGVPFVERIAEEEIVIDDNCIRPGERVRLYLRSLVAGGEHESRHIFGAGHHACVGRQLSLDIWASVKIAFGGISRSARLVEVAYDNDNTFAIPRLVRLSSQA